MAVTPKSFITMIWRSVLPPEMGMTVAPSAFGAVVRAQSAGEQAVAVGVLHDVAVMQTAGGEAAHHHRGPHLQVLLRVSDDDGLAGGAAGGVQAHDLLHRAGEQPEGIGVAQIGLHGEGQQRNVVERADVFGHHPAFVQARAEERHVVVGARDDLAQAAELQRGQLRGGRKSGALTGWKRAGAAVFSGNMCASMSGVGGRRTETSAEDDETATA